MNSLCNLPEVLAIAGMKAVDIGGLLKKKQILTWQILDLVFVFLVIKEDNGWPLLGTTCSIIAAVDVRASTLNDLILSRERNQHTRVLAVLCVFVFNASRLMFHEHATI